MPSPALAASIAASAVLTISLGLIRDPRVPSHPAKLQRSGGESASEADAFVSRKLGRCAWHAVALAR